jgi:DNA-nicking Smr family endonuclease
MKKREAKHVPPGDDVSDPGNLAAFDREMADVVPLRQDPRGRIRGARPIDEPRPAKSPADHTGGPDEDFGAPGVGRREIKKLKRGEFVVEGELDLHGRTAADACATVRRFIENSRHRGHRCVCIVHGRGLHSEGKSSILKPRVRECLRASPSVLAYASAPRSDGGAGAVYVLLRR